MSIHSCTCTQIKVISANSTLRPRTSIIPPSLRSVLSYVLGIHLCQHLSLVMYYIMYSTYVSTSTNWTWLWLWSYVFIVSVLFGNVFFDRKVFMRIFTNISFGMNFSFYFFFISCLFPTPFVLLERTIAFDGIYRAWDVHFFFDINPNSMGGGSFWPCDAKFREKKKCPCLHDNNIALIKQISLFDNGKPQKK